MKTIYMLRGQCSGVDYALAFSSPPSADIVAQATAHENAMHGPSKDGSPRWVRVHELQLLEDGDPMPVMAKASAGSVNAAALQPFAISGEGSVKNP